MNFTSLIASSVLGAVVFNKNNHARLMITGVL